MTDLCFFGSLICNIVQTKTSAELFSNVESFSAILKCFHRSKTSDDAFWIATSIFNILYYDPSSNKLLNSLPVVEAFSFIIPLANEADAVHCISNALKKIIYRNDEIQLRFGTAEFLNIFEAMETLATTTDAKNVFQFVVGVLKPIALLSNSSSSQKLTSALESIIKYQVHVPTLIDLLLQKQHLIQDQQTAIAVANFIKWFGENDLNSVAKREIFELIENVLFPKFGINNTYSMFEALKVLFKEESARTYFAKTLFHDFVCFSLSVPSANSLLKVLHLILSTNNKAREIFGNSEFKNKIRLQLQRKHVNGIQQHHQTFGRRSHQCSSRNSEETRQGTRLEGRRRASEKACGARNRRA